MFDKNCIHWCELCDTICYAFPCCGNTTCNGGGCPDCQPINNSVYATMCDLEPLIDTNLLKNSGTLKINGIIHKTTNYPLTD